MSSKNKYRPFRRPEQQGRVDGMCAVYAVLNCVKLLFNHTEKQDTALFKHLCDSCPELFPKIVYEGTGVPGVRKILAAATGWVEKNHPGHTLKTTTPLMRGKLSTLAAYFETLRHYIEGSCAVDFEAPGGVRYSGAWIIGLGTPWDHWTVVRDMSDKLVMFYDSYGMRRYRHDSFTLDKKSAGEGSGKKIMIDYHQSFWVKRGYTADTRVSGDG